MKRHKLSLSELSFLTRSPFPISGPTQTGARSLTMVSAKAFGYIVAVPDTKEYLRPVKQKCLPMFKRDFLSALNDNNPGLFVSPCAHGNGSVLDVPISPGNEIEKFGKLGSPE